MPNQPIPVSQANEMINAYLTYMTSLGVSMSKQTQSVSFTKSEFDKWWDIVKDHADELRVFMADYPVGVEHAGRTTVILWPYKNGQPAKWLQENGEPGDDDVEPFNQGSLNP